MVVESATGNLIYRKYNQFFPSVFPYFSSLSFLLASFIIIIQDNKAYSSTSRIGEFGSRSSGYSFGGMMTIEVIII